MNEGKAPRGPGEILVADDSVTSLQFLTEFLTAQGYIVHPACDGERALEFVCTSLPDLILLDVRMPGIDGYEVCRRLKADERTRSIPVIFISVLGNASDKVRAFEVGGVDYITKPLQPEEVRARIQTHLRLHEVSERLEQEIIDRRRTEQRLQESEERLRLTLEATGVGMWDWDVPNDLWYGSPGYYTQLGYEPRTDPGNRAEWLERVHPDDRALVRERIQGVLAQHFKDHQYEARLRHADGTYRWMLVRGFGVEDDRDGNVTRMLGIRVDITDRKQSEERLQRTARELAEAQRIAHLGNWNLDLVKNVLTWSDEIFRIFEIDQTKFGASYEAFLNAIHPEDRDMVNNAYTESVRCRVPYDIVHRLRMEDGRIKYVNERCETFYADDGAPLRSAGTVHDITDRRQAEDEIRKLNEQLEARVAETTAQFQASNKELEDFAYSVSHDLRTPLRAIDGYRGLLEKRIASGLDDESRRYLEVISRGATRMGRLIDDLLAFSKIGRFELKRQPVDMGALVGEIIEELAHEASDREVRWHITRLPRATGDRGMLRMVLLNLIWNAVKFTRTRATAEITIGSREEKDEIVFFISDNGVGFDMQYVGKLFGVFQRLHGVDEFEGTGIGLANVRRIIERHGGRTWAEGKVDGGATFYFSLPRPGAA